MYYLDMTKVGILIPLVLDASQIQLQTLSIQIIQVFLSLIVVWALLSLIVCQNKQGYWINHKLFGGSQQLLCIAKDNQYYRHREPYLSTKQ